MGSWGECPGRGRPNPGAADGNDDHGCTSNDFATRDHRCSHHHGCASNDRCRFDDGSSGHGDKLAPSSQAGT
ncbi:MAG: hypothetical protein QGH55_08040, partial [Acidimicrobiales bacterium]|nr:hypothetical protein [Acidimicrobiales bacterium]